MNSSIAVIVATKGRPQELRGLLEALASQSVRPVLIVVSACDQSDVPPMDVSPSNLMVLFGPPGSSAQRNRALSEVRGCDIVVFFDDDFLPSRFWIEHVHALFSAHSDLICVTGKVLADGVLSGGMKWSDGIAIVDRADASGQRPITDYSLKDRHPPYGCNMAFRAKSIENLTFDERLVLYGWLEDRDFSARAGARMVWTDAVWGVHLGTTRGRSSGLRFGYSQVANPWYLVRKGTMSSFEARQTIFRTFVRNAIGSAFPDSLVDRRGRLKGNMTALKDIALGRSAPERAAEL